MSTLNLTENGISWSDFRIAVDGTSLVGSDPNQNDYSAFVIFQELAMARKAGSPNEVASVLWDDLVTYVSTDEQDYSKVYYDLGLPDVYTGPVYLQANGAIGSREASIRLLFPDTVSVMGPHGDRNLVRKGLLLQSNKLGYNYSCSPMLYLLARSIDTYNHNTSKQQEKGHILLDFARIKRLAGEVQAFMDNVIQSEEVIETDQIKLVFEEQGEGADKSVSIVPLIAVPDQPEGASIDKFKKRIEVDLVANYERKNGGRIRTVINEKSKKALEVIKKKYQGVTDYAEIQKLIDNPPEEFDESGIDLSEIYSDRVKGLGIYRPKAWPFICPYKTEWIPGIMVEGIDEKHPIKIESEEELEKLIELAEQARKSGNNFVEINGQKIDLGVVDRFIEMAKDKRSSSDKSPAEAAAKYKVLLIEENVDELLYKETDAGNEIEDREVEVPGLQASFEFKKYQKEGIARLVALFDANYPGMIIADDMGLGKTIQALAFLEYLSRRERGILACIVCPKGLIGNWIKEYRKYFEDGWLVLSSLASDKSMIFDIKKNESKYRNSVFIFSYESLRRNQLDLCAIHWDIAILDEAQKIKTPGTLVTNAAKALKADFKVSMTGTPVENTFHDLWCIADFSMPGFLGSAKKFAEEFNPSNDDDVETIRKKGEDLRNKLGKRFLRRIKEDVLLELPPKYESDNPEHEDKFKLTPTINIMPELQHCAYDQVIADYKSKKETGEIKGKRGMLDILYLLKSACEHPFFISEKSELALDHINDSAKAMALIDILDSIKIRNEKAIVFAEYRRSQRFLAGLIHDRYGLRPNVINGDTPVGFDADACTGTRLGIVEQFNLQSGFDVIIMSPIAAGVGLTVTGANHVIHFSRHWNPSKEDQATDRAYRIGQTKPVCVYYLIARHPNEKINSFDDNLAKLLFSKRGLRGAVLYPSEMVEIKPEDIFEESVK